MSNGHEHCVAQAYEDSPLRTFGKLRYHLFVCSDGKDFCGCEAHGGGALLAALRHELVKRRLMAAVKITLMQCRQQGAAGPVLVVHPDGIWYEGLPVAQVAEFVKRQIVRGEPLAPFLMRGPPMPVTAVPAHVAAPAGCCATAAPGAGERPAAT